MGGLESSSGRPFSMAVEPGFEIIGFQNAPCHDGWDYGAINEEHLVFSSTDGCATPTDFDNQNSFGYIEYRHQADREIVTIGSSSSNSRCVDHPVSVVCEDDAGNKARRVNVHSAGDTFAITVTGGQVCAKRTDKSLGWGMNLQVSCSKASPWRVKMPGTTLTGSFINHGTPSPVTLKLDLGDNVWIVGLVSSDGYLKMVKIQVTGSTTYNWIGTRYDNGFSSACGEPATFTVDCFKGADPMIPSTDMYPVDLHAEQAMVVHMSN